jgi:hypothetical protein
MRHQASFEWMPFLTRPRLQVLVFRELQRLGGHMQRREFITLRGGATTVWLLRVRAATAGAWAPPDLLASAGVAYARH